jgi:hypothetical protein
MPRPTKPRPPIVVRPSFVSDETTFAVLGITPRKFREQVVPKCERVSRIGHTVAVELEEAERVMRSLAAAGDEPAIDLTHEDDDQPTTPDAVLARIGKERVAS